MKFSCRRWYFNWTLKDKISRLTGAKRYRSGSSLSLISNCLKWCVAKASCVVWLVNNCVWRRSWKGTLDEVLNDPGFVLGWQPAAIWCVLVVGWRMGWGQGSVRRLFRGTWWTRFLLRLTVAVVGEGEGNVEGRPAWDDWVPGTSSARTQRPSWLWRCYSALYSSGP